jgi:hypothetical protein
MRLRVALARSALIGSPQLAPAIALRAALVRVQDQLVPPRPSNRAYRRKNRAWAIDQSTGKFFDSMNGLFRRHPLQGDESESQRLNHIQPVSLPESRAEEPALP